MKKRLIYHTVFALGVIDVILYAMTTRHSPARQYFHFDSTSPVWVVLVTLEIVLLVAMGATVLIASRKGK